MSKLSSEAEEILRAGLMTMLRETFIKESLANGKSQEEAEKHADNYLDTPTGQAHLKKHLFEKQQELLNKDLLEAIERSSGFWRGVGVNLFSGAVGSVLGPFVWGVVILTFSIGQNNTALPDNKAKEIIKNITPKEERLANSSKENNASTK